MSSLGSLGTLASISNELTSQDLEHFGDELRKFLGRTTGTRDQVAREGLERDGSGLDIQGDAGTDNEFEEVDLDVVEGEDAAAQAAVAALQRISEGTYGRCTECNEWIPRGRLETVPAAALCVACQEELEGESS